MTLRTVGLVRRGLSVAVDASTALLAVVAGFAFELFDASIFSPEPGWFWTEWLLKFWLDDPSQLFRPAVWWVGITISWVVGWELASGRTPGDRLLGIRVVDSEGEVPHPVRVGLRALGIVLNTASFGLGWLLGFVTPGRRALHDVISGTYVIPANPK